MRTETSKRLPFKDHQLLFSINVTRRDSHLTYNTFVHKKVILLTIFAKSLRNTCIDIDLNVFLNPTRKPFLFSIFSERYFKINVRWRLRCSKHLTPHRYTHPPFAENFGRKNVHLHSNLTSNGVLTKRDFHL